MTKPPTRQHEMIFGQSEIMVPPEIEESLVMLLAQMLLAMYPTKREGIGNDQDQQ